MNASSEFTFAPNVKPLPGGFDNNTYHHHTSLLSQFGPTAFQIGTGLFKCVTNILSLLILPHWKSIYSSTRLVLASISMSDLLSGVTMLAISVINIKYGVMSKAQCLHSTAVLQVSLLVTMSCLVISIANLQSLVSRKNITVLKTRVQILVIWCIWPLLAILGCTVAQKSPLDNIPCFFGNNYYNNPYIISTLSIMFCHLIFIIALQTVFKMDLNQHAKRVGPDICGQTVQASSIYRLKRITKINKLIVIMQGICIVTCFPCIVVVTLYRLCPGGCGVSRLHVSFTGALLALNSTSNIFIFYARSTSFKTALKRLFHIHI